MRLSAWPRITGRLAPGAKPLPAIPGWLESVSPSDGADDCLSAFSFRIVTDCALSVSLSSMAPPVTTTRSVSAVVDGVAEAAGATASWGGGARAMGSTAIAVIRNLFMEKFCEIHWLNAG